MLVKTVISFILTVLSVSSECDQVFQQQNVRVKRGKYYSSPPIRFYNHPPMTVPIKGPFSYTPPPFMADDESPYPGIRPYKVSKRPIPPNNDGLGDDDIANLVKYMSKQDLNKILEFAHGRDSSYNKYKDIYNNNEYVRPYKLENKVPYKGNGHIKYEEPTSYKEDLLQFFNSVTEPTPANFLNSQENQFSKPAQIKVQNYPVTQRAPNEMGSFSADQASYGSQLSPGFSITNNYGTESMYFKVYDAQESPKSHFQIETERYTPNNDLVYKEQENVKGIIQYPVSNKPLFSETNEEEKLPPPVNMRVEDYEASYTNNVPKVENPESYDVKNFGDLPLMDYSSKLHDVSSYHVPHYTVTQSKLPKAPSAPVSITSSASHSSSSSSTLLKPSPAAAGILEPIYEKAPSISAAAEQSDAHLKAIKIWSYKSRGAAYTLHDDGSLSPERSRPMYG